MELKSIDYQNPKDIAYKFTLLAELFVDEKRENEYKRIVKELESFKYKKDIPDMPESLKNRVKSFIKGLK